MNNEIYLKLNTIDKVQKFVKIVNEFDSDIDVIKGRYVIDGKSIMGLFSVNLLEPLLVKINTEDEKEIKIFNNVMEEFK